MLFIETQQQQLESLLPLESPSCVSVGGVMLGFWGGGTFRASHREDLHFDLEALRKFSERGITRSMLLSMYSERRFSSLINIK